VSELGTHLSDLVGQGRLKFGRDSPEVIAILVTFDQSLTKLRMWSSMRRASGTQDRNKRDLRLYRENPVAQKCQRTQPPRSLSLAFGSGAPSTTALIKDKITTCSAHAQVCRDSGYPGARWNLYRPGVIHRLAPTRA